MTPCKRPVHKQLVKVSDAELSELMVTQLKEALASESRRVASAWKAKEQLREAMQSRDEQLVALNAELFTVKADLDARDEQMAQLQEAQRLGTILVEGAEERRRRTNASMLYMLEHRRDEWPRANAACDLCGQRSIDGLSQA